MIRIEKTVCKSIVYLPKTYIMKQLLFISILSILFVGCKKEVKKTQTKVFSEVLVEDLYVNDSTSIRALELVKNGFVFAGNNGELGEFDGNKVDIKELKHDSIVPHFRSICSNEKSVFVLSIASPALLFKDGKLVYEEVHEKVFYDSMKFWNEQEGIALGDEMNGCMSVIITRDGGGTWNKLPCSDLPAIKEGTGAFAASNTNISIIGDKTWLATGGLESSILYSPDKGVTWEKITTPIIQGQATQGIYSLDFYDEKNGFAIGGAYDKPNDTLANKMLTKDGGKTWQIVANAKAPGYRSCVQYIPNSDAKELVAVGFKGISYSNDAGDNWKQLSDESFYTFRFVNDSTAYAAGKGRVSKLVFR